MFVAVDGSGAGSGNLEILVNGGHVTSFVRNLGNQRFLASFVPHEGLSHLVEMKFNGEAVPGKLLFKWINGRYNIDFSIVSHTSVRCMKTSIFKKKSQNIDNLLLTSTLPGLGDLSRKLFLQVCCFDSDFGQSRLFQLLSSFK